MNCRQCHQLMPLDREDVICLRCRKARIIGRRKARAKVKPNETPACFTWHRRRINLPLADWGAHAA